jgi:hypothetical protein
MIHKERGARNSHQRTLGRKHPHIPLSLSEFTVPQESSVDCLIKGVIPLFVGSAWNRLRTALP